MTVNVFDEGVILAGADRIQKGHIPYNDFWTVYPPGQYYVLAFLFDIFGSSTFVARVYDIIVKSTLSISIFYVIRKLVFSNKIALIGWAMSIVWIGENTLPVYPVYPAILLTYLAVYFFLCHIEKNDNLLLIYSVMLITASSIFRHDLAGFTAVTILTAMLIRSVFNGKTTWPIIRCYVASYLIIGLPILVFIFINIEPKELVSQLLLIPAEIMPKYRWLPYPYLSRGTIAFFVFPLVLLTGFMVSLLRIIRYKESDNICYGIFVISLQGLLFSNQVRVRSDIWHLLPVALNSIILIPILWSLLSKTLIPYRRWIINSIFIVTFSIIFISPTHKKLHSIEINYFATNKKYGLKRAGYSRIPEDLEKVVSYIQNITTKDETIYVGVKNHDQFIVNHPIIYYLAARNYPTKFHQHDPGVSNTLSAQKQIIKELEISSTRKLILTKSYWFEPNDTRIDSKIDMLDVHIKRIYELEAEFGRYEVWSKKAVIINN